MTQKLVILLLTSDPSRPSTLGAPFFQATVAAAMDIPADVFFAGECSRLLIRGTAEQIYPGRGHEKSLYSFMQDAHQAGARFYACAGAMAEHGLTRENAVPELDGIVGGAAFIGEAAEPGVITLTY